MPANGPVRRRKTPVETLPMAEPDSGADEVPPRRQERKVRERRGPYGRERLSLHEHVIGVRTVFLPGKPQSRGRGGLGVPFHQEDRVIECRDRRAEVDLRGGLAESRTFL